MDTTYITRHVYRYLHGHHIHNSPRSLCTTTYMDTTYITRTITHPYIHVCDNVTSDTYMCVTMWPRIHTCVWLCDLGYIHVCDHVTWDTYMCVTMWPRVHTCVCPCDLGYIHVCAHVTSDTYMCVTKCDISYNDLDILSVVICIFRLKHRTTRMALMLALLHLCWQGNWVYYWGESSSYTLAAINKYTHANSQSCRQFYVILEILADFETHSKYFTMALKQPSLLSLHSRGPSSAFRYNFKHQNHYHNPQRQASPSQS
jgi:hypothetical protein